MCPRLSALRIFPLTGAPPASSAFHVIQDGSMRKRTVRTAGVVVILGAAGVLTAALSHSAWAAGTFNVKDYGAKGNGSTIDSPAIDRAITAANAAGGGTVVFPSGTYQSRSIHLKSN